MTDSFVEPKNNSFNKKRCYIVGNGPSIERQIFKFLSDKPWLGMNSAFRHWNKIKIFPQHYACLDKVVAESIVTDICELVLSSPIETFFLHESIRAQVDKLGSAKRIVFLDDFLESNNKRLLMSFKSRNKITTGSLACRYMVEMGYDDLVLYGIDCNYVNLLPETKELSGLSLSISKKIKRNPNYYFDDYQKLGDKYQIPNPIEHSGNLHLQSFVSFKDDIEASKVPIAVKIATTQSLLYKRGIFPYCDPSTEVFRKLQCVAVPLTKMEIPQLLENIKQWKNPNFVPSFGEKRGTVLHLIFDCALSVSELTNLKNAIDNLEIPETQFESIKISMLELPDEINYYIRPSQKSDKRCQKSGPNISFLALLKVSEQHLYTLLMETDCVPLKAGWLDSLEAEILANQEAWIIGSAYLGPSPLANPNRLHINGNAIYKTGSVRFQVFMEETFTPLLMHFIYRGAAHLAYDCLLSHAFHNFSTIPELFKEKLLAALPYFRYSEMILNLGGERENSNVNLIDGKKLMFGNAAIGHGRSVPIVQHENQDAADKFFSHRNNFTCLDLPFVSLWCGLEKFRIIENSGYGIFYVSIPSAAEGAHLAIHFSCIDKIGKWLVNCSGELVGITSRVRKIELRLIDRANNVVETIDSVLTTQSHDRVLLNFKSEIHARLIDGYCIQILFTIDPGPLFKLRSSGIKMSMTSDSIIRYDECNVIKPEVAQVIANWKHFISRLNALDNDKSPMDSIGRPEFERPIPKCLEGRINPRCDAVITFGEAGFVDEAPEIYFRLWQKSSYVGFCYNDGLGVADTIYSNLELQASAPCSLKIALCRHGDSPFEGVERIVFLDGRRKTINLNFESEHKHTGYRVQIYLHRLFAGGEVRVRVLVANVGRKAQGKSDTQVAGHFISINPDLIDSFGHYEPMDRQLMRESLKFGWKFSSLANIKTTSPEDWIRPVFSRKTYELTETRISDWRAGLSNKDIEQFARELEKSIQSLLHSTQRTLVYCYMTSPAVLCGILLATRKLNAPHITFVCCISSMFFNKNDIECINETDVLSDIAKEGGNTIRFVTDIECLIGCNAMNNIISHYFPLFPLLSEYKRKVKKDANLQKLSVVYASNSQWSKGYDLLVDFLDLFSEELSPYFDFVVRFFPRDRSLNYPAMRERLLKMRNVRLIEGQLSELEYAQLISQADIMLIPYRPETFMYRTSAQFVDAIMSCAPILASENTWAGDLVRRFDCGATFDSRSVISLRNALDRIRHSYSFFLSNTITAQQAWNELYSAERFFCDIRDLGAPGINDAEESKSNAVTSSSFEEVTLKKANELYRNRNFSAALKIYEALSQRHVNFSLYQMSIKRCQIKLRNTTK